MKRPQMDRRTFAKSVAAAAVAGGLAGAPPAGRGDGRPGASKRPVPAGSVLRGQGQQGEPSPSARALAQVLRERFGGRFTDEQYERIVRDIDAGLRRAATLRQQRLANADEPAFVFAPFRREP